MPQELQSRNFVFQTSDKKLQLTLSASELGFAPLTIWNPSPSVHHRLTPYDVPQKIHLGMRDNEHTAAKYSPAPYAVLIEAGEQRAFVGVVADDGWHRFNDVYFEATETAVTVTIDLEGRTDPAEMVKHVKLDVIPADAGESRHDTLRRALMVQYPGAQTKSEPPEWWLRPIYCGWGDQDTFAFHHEGIGPECRALAYCIQGLYERWVRVLEKHNVPVGTITIDAGWSQSGVWQPDEIKWPDLRKFVDDQHARGRKVLLWISTWLWEGLPEELCVMGDGKPITADPTNPAYLELVKEWVTQLLSPDGYNADGFKIDQLSYSPTHRAPTIFGPRFGSCIDHDEPIENITMHGDNWGAELLHDYQKAIYDAAKAAKPDALITSSTVHPYFHDTFDMVRIHDMGNVAEDIMAAMKARCDLGRAAVPGKPVDADDWIHTDYQLWLDYTCNSHTLGVPCIFYAERFMANWHEEPATKPITDLPTIAAAWKAAGFS